MLIGFLPLVFIGLAVGQVQEPCRKDAYPPPEKTRIPTVVVNLDEAPEDRWTHIVAPKTQQIIQLIGVFRALLPSQVFKFMDQYFPTIFKNLPEPYVDEMKGISKATGIAMGEIIFYNLFYEISSACTSIVGQDEKGKLYHARNLDFGMFMGWDNKNNTWILTERLRQLMINVNYQKNGKTVYRAVHFSGYVGLLTAIKQHSFTFTINRRHSLKDSGIVGIIEWLIGVSHGKWLGFFTRDLLENASNYAEAVSLLTNTELLAPAYFILGGTNSGEACVITRGREGVVDHWQMNTTKGDWYLLETNYDHWKSPLFIDDRRTPGNICMKELTQKGMGFKGLFNVLSTRPNLNKMTTYTSLMQVDDGLLESYLQDCLDPCWPW